MIEILARTLEHQAENEPSKLYREQKMRAAQIFREKMNGRRKENLPTINYRFGAKCRPRWVNAKPRTSDADEQI